MEELIEKLRAKYLEKDQIIESQIKEVDSAREDVKRLNGMNAQLHGQVLELQSKLKRFRELVKEAEQ